MSQELLIEKWNELLENERVGSITDPIRKKVTAQLLENEEKFLAEEASTTANLPGGGVVGQNWDPILIGMVRRMAPKLIAYDICGVQPMTAPTGLVFAMRARYADLKDQNGVMLEAQGLDEAKAGYGGNGENLDITNPFSSSFEDKTDGMATNVAETQNPWKSMTTTIERTDVTAKSYQLRADWSLELMQDLRAVHGLDAESELSNILSTEIIQEINRQIIRKIYTAAKVGGQHYATPGTFDLVADADGRWSVEKFKGLFFCLEKEANQIAIETRRGKGNLIICSANVASAMVMAGLLDIGSNAKNLADLEVDVTGTTYAGMAGRHKVYIDPYLSYDGFVMGYKGPGQYDAGLYYCPYVPLQMVRATDPMTFRPAIGFKTRYGLVANPFVVQERPTDPVKPGKGLGKGENQYYRKVQITGL